MMRVLWGMALVLSAGALSAASVEDVLGRLERSEGEIKTLSFDYRQTASLSVGKTETAVSGRVSFQRPDRFRIETAGPAAQTVVSDGTHLWIHTPAHKQVIRDTLKGVLGAQGVPAGLGSFQWKAADLKREFNVSVDDAAGETPVLVLTPKAGGDTVVRLWVDMKTGVAMKTALSAETVKTEVTLANVRVNPRLAKTLFRFKPPAGTEVLDMPVIAP
ncbi:MAG: outer membrane lipoprotein carrier protein LolA [Elusimicrobia bacterium]|jgi:outer membrane lipoprotein carrier protein|nr:outer membrane lipoprotein carrier protein LolA [Elusimicrobiota bacterium]MBK7208428.1 outer membrane lipoprotein carrier protein LolA [Elusimicrobiota bacterium]MBK7545188.1 outer membrane lipoprotein carrier protein LolA [Elusimicrobiota bacterium]MBK7574709.1 outer membrane lipoprotein carrier protein LolA [Elusimicrobiota bacterium]MBK7688717.1 outer membrane lipoprotein carrier protein LolA [Elusimicrobiota bacterium]